MNANTLTETFMGLLLMVPYGIIGILAFLVADWLLGMRESYHSGELIKGGNVAVGLRRFGLFVAIGIGMSGVYASGGSDLMADLKDSLLYASLLVLMVHFALFLNDVVVLPGVPNSKEVGDGNTAVAAAEVGSMIATGLIAKSAIAGEGGGLLVTLVFFVLGQVALLLAVRCYAAFHHPCRIVHHVESRNLAAGIVLGAKFMAYGLVVSTALVGSFAGWIDGITSFAITAAVGIVFLLAVDFIVDWLLVRWHTLRQLIDGGNVGSALVFAGGKVGMAYIISTLVL